MSLCTVAFARNARKTRTHGAETQIDPRRDGEPRRDRRRCRMHSRRRPRRRAHRNRVWPCGRRDLRFGGCGDLRREGAAGDQPAHRPRSQPRGGARARHLQSRGRTAGGRILARAPHSGFARNADLPDQSARARRTRHCGASLAGRRNRAGAHQGGGRAARGALRQSLGPGEPDDSPPCRRRSRRQG